MRAIPRIVVVALGACAALVATARPLTSLNIRPVGLSDEYEAIPLGQVRVTHYTHHECNSRLTSSGYVLKDEDEGRVCAISRDWWRGRVKPGDLVWVSGHAQPCVALDTMALKNSKGFPQRRWVDIYYTDQQKALDFGIQRATAYLVRKTDVAAR